ncbi:hypothetical protein AAG570_013246 [Ranatra chinensis]|uniref:Cyclin A n=1 Tax=Ranatra chinensis TaxID=642074 RepID=A0ABD0YG91_9HEMI
MSIDKSPTACNLLAETIKLQLEGLYDCDTYKDDIYRYLRQLETKHRPKAYYMRRQPDVTYSMRAILVDWLVEVGEEYKLHNETLFMAVSYIDRFLSIMAVVRAKLQLLGTSAMFIASKFEEIYPPEIGEFTYITDDTYTKKQVLRMEHLILKVLSFNLSCPTAYTFVVHLSVTASLPDNVFMLAMYLCELTLLEADPYLQYNPSLIASAAIALARHCLGYIEVWTQSLVRASGYNLHNLATVVAHLNSTHSKAATAAPHAIKEKYKVMK